MYNRSSKCNTSILRKIFKHVSKVQVMIGEEGFYGNQPITIISFLIDFRMACNNADVHESAAVWLLPYFLRSNDRISY